jgi:hypothetical protein
MRSQSLCAIPRDYLATEADVDPVQTPAYDGWHSSRPLNYLPAEDQLASPDYFFLDGASFLDEAIDGII